MKAFHIPRQIFIYMLVSASVTVLASVLFYFMLEQSHHESAATTAQAFTQLERSYALFEKLTVARSTVERLLRLKDPDELEKVLKEIETTRKASENLVAALGEMRAPIVSRLDAIARTEKSVIDKMLTGSTAGAYEEFRGAAMPQYEALVGEVDKLHAAAAANASAEMSATQARAHRRALWQLGALGIALAIVLAYGGRLALRINSSLRAIAATLAGAGRNVAASSDEVAESSRHLAEDAGQQVASLEETSASLEEMSGMTRRNADHAQAAKNLARQTCAAAEAGAADMSRMNTAMDAIKTSSDGIARIIKTIDDIAFQTNILALNAAVEAARAGEAGLGFAVVADEVRNLAQRSAAAARETASKIEDSINKSQQGVTVSAKVAEGLEQIVAKARQMDELVAQIATASEEQSQGISQINSAVGQMDKITQNTAASAEECSVAAQTLASQSTSLNESVNQLLALAGSHDADAARLAAASANPTDSAPPADPPARARSFHPIRDTRSEPGLRAP